MSVDETKELSRSIRAVIQEIVDDPSLRLANDTPLLSSGLIDSVGVEQLMVWLEDELGVGFYDEDYSVENFDTVDAIEALTRLRARETTV
jgi:acyl carrier protein